MLSVDEGSDLAELFEALWPEAGTGIIDMRRHLGLPFDTDTALLCGWVDEGAPCSFGTCTDDVTRDVGRWLRERFG